MITGITGGIGSGKSVVARVLRCNGFEVYDCDSRARIIMEESDIVKKSLINIFGSKIYFDDGKLNRKYLSSLLFNDHLIREKVNKIVHTAVKNDIKERIKVSKGEFFIESAILYTSGIDKDCDNIWVVEAPKDIKIRRVSKRDGLSLEEIETRMMAQANELGKLKKEKTTILLNDNVFPLLKEILTLTERNNYYQTYTISC